MLFVGVWVGMFWRVLGWVCFRECWGGCVGVGMF